MISIRKHLDAFFDSVKHYNPHEPHSIDFDSCEVRHLIHLSAVDGLYSGLVHGSDSGSVHGWDSRLLH